MRETKVAGKPPIWDQLKRLDWIGIVLLIGGFVMFLLDLTGEALSGLLSSNQTIALYVVGLAMLIVSYYDYRVRLFFDSAKALVIYDLFFCKTTPVIQFRMFESGMFSIAMWNGLLTAFSRGVVLFAAIFLFQGTFASDPFRAGKPILLGAMKY